MKDRLLFFAIIFATVLILYVAVPMRAQVTDAAQLRQVLGEKAEFTEEDFESAAKGEVVIKKLDPLDKREIAVSGLIRLNAPIVAVREAFERAILRERRNTAKQYGRFSFPPKVENLKSLKIDSGELNDLKECRVNDCKWNLSRGVIERIGSETDWSDSKAEETADQLVRESLTEYVGNYLKQGDLALMDYADKPNAVKLRDEYGAMFEELMLVDPQLTEFLTGFPESELSGVEQTVTWSKVKVALKNVILIGHNVGRLNTDDDETGSFFLVSKQIYANHYFDSSLAETSVYSFKEDDEIVSYLLFVNRSRAGALGGRLGRLAKGIVSNRSRGTLEKVLKDTRRYTSIVVANQNVEDEEFDDRWAITRVVTNPTVIGASSVVLLLGLAALFVARRIGRKGL